MKKTGAKSELECLDGWEEDIHRWCCWHVHDLNACLPAACMLAI